MPATLEKVLQLHTAMYLEVFTALFVSHNRNILKFPPFGKTKCAIQILNFTPSASDDIILNHQSKIIPNEQSAGFNYSEDLIPSRVVSSNSALNNVASEQLISIKAQVVNIAATKAVNTQYQGTLKKQEVLIRIIIHF